MLSTSDLGTNIAVAKNSEKKKQKHGDAEAVVISCSRSSSRPGAQQIRVTLKSAAVLCEAKTCFL